MLRLKIALSVAGLLFFSALSAPVWADAVLTVVPTSPTVTAGGTITVDIDVSGAADLYAFQFDLSFDPAFVSAVSISEGAFLPSGGSTFFLAGLIDNTAGSVVSTADALLGAIPGVSGDGTLAILTLRGVSAGTSSIDVSNVFLLDSSLNSIDSTEQSGHLTVTPSTVPEPAAGLFLLVGLAALALLASKKVL